MLNNRSIYQRFNMSSSRLFLLPIIINICLLFIVIDLLDFLDSSYFFCAVQYV